MPGTYEWPETRRIEAIDDDLLAALLVWADRALRGENASPHVAALLAMGGWATIPRDRRYPPGRRAVDAQVRLPGLGETAMRVALETRTRSLVVAVRNGVHVFAPHRHMQTCLVHVTGTRERVVEAMPRHDGDWRLQVRHGAAFVGRRGRTPGHALVLQAETEGGGRYRGLVAAALALVQLSRAWPLAVVVATPCGGPPGPLPALRTDHGTRATLAALRAADPRPATILYAEAAARALAAGHAYLPVPPWIGVDARIPAPDGVSAVLDRLRRLLDVGRLEGIVLMEGGELGAEGYRARPAGFDWLTMPVCLSAAVRRRAIRGELVRLDVRRLVPARRVDCVYLTDGLVAAEVRAPRRLVVHRLEPYAVGALMTLHARLGAPPVCIADPAVAPVVRAIAPAARPCDHDTIAVSAMLLGSLDPRQAPLRPEWGR